MRWDECYRETDSGPVMVPLKQQVLDHFGSCPQRLSVQYNVFGGGKVIPQLGQQFSLSHIQSYSSAKTPTLALATLHICIRRNAHSNTPYQVIHVWRTSLGKNNQRWHHFLGSEEGLVVEVSGQRNNKKQYSGLISSLFFTLVLMMKWHREANMIVILDFLEVGGYIQIYISL